MFEIKRKNDSNTKQIKRENAPNELFLFVAEMLETGYEWLLVSESGSQAHFKRDEIDVIYRNGSVFLECNALEFKGAEDSFARQILSAAIDGRKLVLTFAGEEENEFETAELIPRITAAELTDSINTARLEMAMRIARIAAEKAGNSKIAKFRVSQGIRAGEYGTNAQIFLQISPREQIAVFAPVVAKINSPESFLASALNWFVLASQRAKKYRLEKLWIAVDKKSSAKIKKLIALLKPTWKEGISLFRLDLDDELLHEIKIPEFRNLFREKPRKIKEFKEREPPAIANVIIEQEPESIDVTYSMHGENLRFHGLPFMRVRTLLGEEKAWFGTSQKREALDASKPDDLGLLMDELKEHRSPFAQNKSHYLYRALPEHWLESILRRDITLLDDNLILSPIYRQFRLSSEQIDLLAIRKDGQLVVIELKVAPHREMIFQAANYWRLIEVQRRSGKLAAARAFGDRKIADVPALVYLVAPALSFHPDLEFWAGMISPKIKFYKYDLHENWRASIKVLQRSEIGQ